MATLQRYCATYAFYWPVAGKHQGLCPVVYLYVICKKVQCVVSVCVGPTCLQAADPGIIAAGLACSARATTFMLHLLLQQSYAAPSNKITRDKTRHQEDWAMAPCTSTMGSAPVNTLKVCTSLSKAMFYTSRNVFQLLHII